MISCNKGQVIIRGSQVVIESEFTTLVNSMKKVVGEERIRILFEHGMLSDEAIAELETKLKEKIKNNLEKNFNVKNGDDFIKELLNKLKGDMYDEMGQTH